MWPIQLIYVLFAVHETCDSKNLCRATTATILANGDRNGWTMSGGTPAIMNAEASSTLHPHEADWILQPPLCRRFQS